MNQDIYNLENSTELGYAELFSIFWRRRSYFVGVFSGILALALPFVFAQKPEYESSMQLLIEPNYQSKYDSDEFDPTQSTVQIDYATQVNLMRSSQLLSRAVEELKSNYPDITTEDIKNYLVVTQLKEQEDKKEVGTKIFQANFKGDSSKKTLQVLEAIQKVYLEYNLDQQSKRLKEGLSFINEQIPEVRAKLTNSERNLEELLTEYNLIAPSTEALNMSQGLKEIQQKREELKAQYSQYEGKQSALEEDLADSDTGAKVETDARLTLSTRYQNLLDELQKVDLQLEEQRSRFTESSPIVQNLLNQRANKQLLLKQEAKKILGSDELALAEIDNLENRRPLDPGDLEKVQALSAAQNELRALESREKSLAETEQKLKQRLNEFPNLIARYNSLEQEVEVNRATLKKLLEYRQEIGIIINRGGFSWEVIEPPQSGEKIGPSLPKDIALSTIFAFFAGSVSVFVIEASDNKIRGSKQLQNKANLPLLGTTPGLPKVKEDGFVARLPFFSSDRSEELPIKIIEWLPFRESLDMVYENIQNSLTKQDSKVKSVAVTSAIPEEGKSTITLGLALSAARRHKKVLVIDGDLRCPSIHDKLGITNDIGLSDLLAGRTKTPNTSTVALSNLSIDVLTSGSITVDPVQLLSSERLQEFIWKVEDRYDLVLVDTPPAIGMVDAIKIASCCSGTVVVARLEKASFTQVSETFNLLDRLNLLGIVANDSKEIQKRYLKNKRYLPYAQV
ncbi:exopolysaccharide transport family protein [Waterburya agarophytonicola K14]|uniref:Exopolysaccharide transport family protein n=1 Tax=Waterburya agarophytonicola KI4 TaxID=2874699 RepID=A0A964BQD2_9CYAN|nr:exopolysaccharide transport family protein [Waterburya agarophytonicola]MCC0177664.1 exopolysaccharide transport family protein [Waterburya agarophytonicola KI4]